MTQLDHTPRLLRNEPQQPAAKHIRPLVQDLSTENIAELAVRAQQLSGVIPLWYGEGDLVTPEFIRDAAKSALDQGKTFYIPNMRGAPELSQALADYQTRLHGVPIGIERSTVTPGGMQSLLIALNLIVDLGQNVVYVEPQWPNIHNLIHLAGGEPRAVPLLMIDGEWTLDMEAIKAACDARTRAIVFSTPANPTGWVASREDLEALLAFGRERGIWIISDEVYNRLYFSADAAPSILQIADPEDLVLTVNSFSKAWAMTGWRVGWVTHPSSVAGEVAAMTQYMNSGTAGFVQAGALAAIEHGEELAGQMRDRCRNGIDLAYEKLSKVDDIILPNKPKGGMYVFFSLASEPDSRVACRTILEKARVGLAPGYMFGQASNNFLRMCICRDPAQLETALQRMVEAFEG
ncbi:MAG: aspartate aminotransferase [Microvirga sp.]|nr:aspartate aminotransferase [Microvirga sp.]